MNAPLILPIHKLRQVVGLHAQARELQLCALFGLLGKV